MKIKLTFFLCYVLLMCNLTTAQNQSILKRVVNLNELNQLEVSYTVLNDSLNGFFIISDSIVGKVKLVSSSPIFPFKFQDNLLQISGHKLVSNLEIKFTFKTFEQDLSISGQANFENYPNNQIVQKFESNQFKLKPEVEIASKVDVPAIEKPKNAVIVDTNTSGIRFRVQIAAATSKMDKEKLKTLTNLSLNVNEDLIVIYYKYTIGNEVTIADAQQILNKLAVKNFKKPFIVAYKNGKRIPVQEAMAEINANR